MVCPICLRALSGVFWGVPARRRVAASSHNYHIPCLNEVLRVGGRRAICPMCRAPFKDVLIREAEFQEEEEEEEDEVLVPPVAAVVLAPPVDPVAVLPAPVLPVGPLATSNACHLCHRSFNSRSALSHHMEMHSPVSCHLCQQIFTRRTSLNRHTLHKHT